MAPVQDYGEPGGRADFEFAGGTGGAGTAWFFDAPEGVRAYVMIRDMAPGTHAIHVHETGDCSAPDFTSAGDHLGVDAGQTLPDRPDDFEAGMLPDIAIGDDGSGELNAVLEVVTFTEDTDRTWPLFDADGAAIVIHRFATGDLPAGEDNPRIACAEIYPSDL
jgi:Cu-Zn family superoxide dismutase